MEAKDLARLADALLDAGEAGRVARQHLGEHVQATYLADAETVQAVGLVAWSGLASRLAADLSEEQRAAWAAGLRSAFVEDPDVLAALGRVDVEHLEDALAALGDPQPYGPTAAWFEATEAWQAMEAKDLARLAADLLDASEAGASARQRLAEHVTATYLTDAETVRAVGLEAWSGLASRLAADLSEEQRAVWAAGLRSAFVEDPDVLAALGRVDVVEHLADALATLGDPQAGALARQRLAEHVTATYLTDAETIRSVGLEAWSGFASSLAADLSEEQRAAWETRLRAAFFEDSDVLNALMGDEIYKLSEALDALGAEQPYGVLAAALERTTPWRVTDDPQVLRTLGWALCLHGLTGTGKGYPAFASALARLAREKRLAAPLDWGDEQWLAAPLGTPETQQVVRDELLDAEGNPRLVIAKTLAWVHRNAGELETWRNYLDEQITKSGISPDAEAGWLVAKAYAEALVSDEPDPDRLAGKKWLEEALSVAESSSLRLEAVRDLVLAYAVAMRYDDGLSFLETIANQFTGEAAEKTLEALGEEVRRHKADWVKDELARVRTNAQELETQALDAAMGGDEELSKAFEQGADSYRQGEKELLEMVE